MCSIENMSNKSFIIYLFGATTAILVCSMVAAQDPKDPDYLAEAYDLLAQLQKSVDLAQSTSKEQFEILKTNLTSLRTSRSESNKAFVLEATERFMKQLEQLRILAVAIGNPQCLEGRIFQFQFISDDLITTIDNCMLRIEVEVNSTISDANVHIEQAQETLVEFEQWLNSCLPNQEDCALHGLGLIQNASDELLTMISDETLKILTSGRTWESDLNDCVDLHKGLIYIHGNRITWEIEECILELGRKVQ